MENPAEPICRQKNGLTLAIFSLCPIYLYSNYYYFGYISRVGSSGK